MLRFNSHLFFLLPFDCIACRVSIQICFSFSDLAFQQNRMVRLEKLRWARALAIPPQKSQSCRQPARNQSAKKLSLRRVYAACKHRADLPHGYSTARKRIQNTTQVTHPFCPKPKTRFTKYRTFHSSQVPRTECRLYIHTCFRLIKYHTIYSSVARSRTRVSKRSSHFAKASCLS